MRAHRSSRCHLPRNSAKHATATSLAAIFNQCLGVTFPLHWLRIGGWSAILGLSSSLWMPKSEKLFADLSVLFFGFILTKTQTKTTAAFWAKQMGGWPMYVVSI